MKFLFHLILFITATCGYAQSPVFSLYLIGDAGLSSVENNGLTELLKQNFNSNVLSAIVLLGDNIYPHGMPPADSRGRAEAETILQTQIQMLRQFNSTIYIIPGNHDWNKGRKKGWEHILNQQSYIDSIADQNVHFSPRDGCPGPIEIQASEGLVLVVLDSQWFLHESDKPHGEGNNCGGGDPEAVVKKLSEVFQRNRNHRIVVLAHHPILTYGAHGGVFTLKDHIFPLTNISHGLYIPLPVVGSLYPLGRKLIKHTQDTGHPLYKSYSESVSNILEQHPGSVYASGHEHSLQYSMRNDVHYVVSGSGSKHSPVKKKGYSSYVSSSIGFVRMDMYEDGTSGITYFEVGKTGATWSTILPSIHK